MNPQDLVKRWRKAIPSDLTWDDLKPVIDKYGFCYRQGKHGWIVQHDKLDLPDRGFITVQVHGQGAQGHVAKRDVRQVLNAIENLDEDTDQGI